MKPEKTSLSSPERHQSVEPLRLEPRVERSAHRPEAADRMVDGVIELMATVEESQRAVRLDWRRSMAGRRDRLEELARPHVERINQQRQEGGGQALELSTISDKFLLGLAEPNWEELMPRDSEDEAQMLRWQQLCDEYPDVADNLDAWYEAHAKLHILRQDAELMQKVDTEWRGERISATRMAHQFMQRQKQQGGIAEQIALLRAKAGRSGRPLTRREKAKIARLQDQLEQAGQPLDMQESVSEGLFLEEVDRLQRQNDRRELREGLLRTPQMEQIIKEALPSMVAGKPVLLVGETGGAKTALAEYMAKQYFGGAEFVSAYGDVNSYQLMGKQELRANDGATESEFMPGPVVRAMERGVPLILDEINAMPPELLKRLNKIVQLKPSDVFTVQEDSGRQVTVQPGFCIIATANEKSKRYRGVDDLSVEFQNRFGSNIYRVQYPDADNSYGEPAVENDRLAFAAIAMPDGTFPDWVNEGDFDNFVRAAFVTQQLFSGNHGEGFSDFITDTSKITDNTPGLEETVLAPRTMVDILQKVADSYGDISFQMACWRFIEGIKNVNDRQVMTLVLSAHRLLPKEGDE